MLTQYFPQHSVLISATSGNQKVLKFCFVFKYNRNTLRFSKLYLDFAHVCSNFFSFWIYQYLRTLRVVENVKLRMLAIRSHLCLLACVVSPPPKVCQCNHLEVNLFFFWVNVKWRVWHLIFRSTLKFVWCYWLFFFFFFLNSSGVTICLLLSLCWCQIFFVLKTPLLLLSWRVSPDCTSRGGMFVFRKPSVQVCVENPERKEWENWVRGKVVLGGTSCKAYCFCNKIKI
jgi:hypothetical protein